MPLSLSSTLLRDLSFVYVSYFIVCIYFTHKQIHGMNEPFGFFSNIGYFRKLEGVSTAHISGPTHVKRKEVFY